MIHEARVPAGRLVFNLDFCKIFVCMGGAANRNPRNSTTDKHGWAQIRSLCPIRVHIPEIEVWKIGNTATSPILQGFR
jgi:hypothetical protein